jgi:hypothetical protein
MERETGRERRKEEREAELEGSLEPINSRPVWTIYNIDFIFKK